MMSLNNVLERYGKNAYKIYQYILDNSRCGQLVLQQKEISESTGISRFNVCKYLKILENAGLIENHKQRMVQNTIIIK